MEHHGLEPVGDDEFVYRRISASAHPPMYEPDRNTLTGQAFAPHKVNDTSGISVYRSKYKTIEAAAIGGRPGKSYYVAVLLTGDIRRAGMSVEPSPRLPEGYDAGHAEIPELNAGNRKSDKTLQLQQILAGLCLEVQGPFEAVSG